MAQKKPWGLPKARFLIQKTNYFLTLAFTLSTNSAVGLKEGM